MDRLARLNEVVKQLDHRLFVQKMPSGAIFVYRSRDPLVASNYGQRAIDPESPDMHDRYVLALTEDWRPFGKPVEWGIEPIMSQLKSMDSWSHDIYREAKEQRDRDEKERARTRSNEFRAIAADIRQDFAKATNDIVIRS